MNPVTSIDLAVFSARVNPQRQAEQAGPNRVDRKPDRVPSDPFSRPTACRLRGTPKIPSEKHST
jgi:hypothetical protein